MIAGGNTTRGHHEPVKGFTVVSNPPAGQVESEAELDQAIKAAVRGYNSRMRNYQSSWTGQPSDQESGRQSGQIDDNLTEEERVIQAMVASANSVRR